MIKGVSGGVGVGVGVGVDRGRRVGVVLWLCRGEVR